MNIIDALDDANVFGHAFKGPTWKAWAVFLKALFALPMSDDELATYRKHTGRSSPPAAPSHEAWLVIGRRGGKSFALATIAVFLACFKDWRPLFRSGRNRHHCDHQSRSSSGATDQAVRLRAPARHTHVGLDH